MIWRSFLQEYAPRRTACVMGILNVTPDSFSDGGQNDAPEAALARAREMIALGSEIHVAEHGAALARAREMIAEGAEIIDVGGESTRPGAEPVSPEEEIRRVVPVIRALRAEWGGGISIDTSKAVVAEAALEAGADIVNDVTGLRGDPAMPALCLRTECAVVVMHMQGEPRTMQREPRYEDVVAEVRAFFRERMEDLLDAGIRAEAMCFDPGIGFGKTREHNLALLRALDSLAPAGRPLLLGVSRKTVLGDILDGAPAFERDGATAVVTALARAQGVMFHRVHDVKGNRDALRVAEAVLDGRMAVAAVISR